MHTLLRTSSTAPCSVGRRQLVFLSTTAAAVLPVIQQQRPITSSRASSSTKAMGKASTSLSKRLHAFVSGGVQGVFLRSYTKVRSRWCVFLLLFVACFLHLHLTLCLCRPPCVDFTHQAKATELGVTGWVRNRRDGRVEVRACARGVTPALIRPWLCAGTHCVRKAGRGVCMSLAGTNTVSPRLGLPI